jgi:hypothetical protein
MATEQPVFNIEEFENKYKDFFTELGYCYRCIKQTCLCLPYVKGQTLREIYGKDFVFQIYIDPTDDTL